MTHQSQSLDVFNRDFANKYVEAGKDIKASLTWDEMIALNLAYNTYSKEMEVTLGKIIKEDSIENIKKESYFFLLYNTCLKFIEFSSAYISAAEPFAPIIARFSMLPKAFLPIDVTDEGISISLRAAMQFSTPSSARYVKSVFSCAIVLSTPPVVGKNLARLFSS